MQFERFYSLNHIILPWFAHLQQLGFQQEEFYQTWLNICGANGVIVQPYAHSQQMKVLKYLLCRIWIWDAV